MPFRPTLLLATALLATVPALATPAAAQEPAETWWAYRPLVRPAVPANGASHPVDAFLLDGLAAEGLTLAEPADRIALIRRATYDLTGLPPAPDDVAAFLADAAPGAFERVVDRLLASPQYGVKWARHWLDLVRYAETDSYERDRTKPGAWRYRDWVVDALNADLPYARFLALQLAGDELEPDRVAALTATGYYRLGIWDDEPTDPLQAVYDDLDGIVDTTARVMLGTSMGCARCHEHKKDPIPQRDYYRLLALFEGLAPYKVGGGNHVNPENFVRRVETDESRSELPARLEAWRRERDELIAEARAIAAEVTPRLEPRRRRELGRDLERGVVTRIALRGEGEVGGGDARGPRAGALRFDGRGDEVRIARPVQDDFTISFWFRADAAGPGGDERRRWFTGAGLVDGEIGGIVDDFGVALVGGHVAAGVGNPETFVSSGPGHADGAWHHVAFTRTRASGAIELFVDGARAGAATGGTQALTAPATLAVGRLQPGNNPFRGAIDDLRIHDRALSHQEVLGLYLGAGFENGIDAEIAAHIGEPEAERYRHAVARLAELERPTPAFVRVLCAQERGEPAPSHVRVRGNVHALGEAVTPGYPAVMGGGDAAVTPAAASSGRRSAFAAWLTRPDHPLTWRVIANRIWQHHFGRGIVRTPNDFGRLGELPTHPELLDWLATELVARGGSLKAMHRLIMTSRAYRMSSRPSGRALERDPINDRFSRFDMRRLTAEELRDSILAVHGALNTELGGPSVFPPMPEEVLQTASRPGEAWGSSPPDQADRRSLYIKVKRSLLMPLLTVFDLADTDTTCPVRFVTTQPTQALTMLNSDFIAAEAERLAARLRAEAAGTRERVALGLRLVTSREPAAGAVDAGAALIDDLVRDEGVDPDLALQRYCLVLFNLNEFVYLD